RILRGRCVHYPLSEASLRFKVQVNNTLNALLEAGADFGTLWLEVKIEHYHWFPSTNRQLIMDVVEQCNALGVKVGIYTSKYDWETIVGPSWTEVSSLPLWWFLYNGQSNFNNFIPFGGWNKPTIHQYSASVNGACSVGQHELAP
ncbi:hypothetical protein PMAYCL1PPCAC_22229, partial [Pristionchus mayeri]